MSPTNEINQDMTKRRISSKEVSRRSLKSKYVCLLSIKMLMVTMVLIQTMFVPLTDACSCLHSHPQEHYCSADFGTYQIHSFIPLLLFVMSTCMTNIDMEWLKFKPFERKKEFEGWNEAKKWIFHSTFRKIWERKWKVDTKFNHFFVELFICIDFVTTFWSLSLLFVTISV